jgi:hypothetical protein
LALRRPDLNLDILPLGITKIAERLAKWPHGFWATDEKHADARHLRRLLRAHRKRPCRRAAHQHHKLAPPHTSAPKD